jgi:Flp pilus assembly pilin Flp
LTDGRGRTGWKATRRGPTALNHSTESPARGQARRLADDEGQGLVEYGLILVIMALVCVISLVFFGDQLSTLLQLITSAV